MHGQRIRMRQAPGKIKEILGSGAMEGRENEKEIPISPLTGKNSVETFEMITSVKKTRYENGRE